MRGGVFAGERLLPRSVVRCPSPSFVSHPRTSTAELQELLWESIVSTVERLKAMHPRLVLDRIGIAIPGPVGENGAVRVAPPLWGKAERVFRLRDRIEKNLNMHCVVVNDMTAVTAWYGHLPSLRRHRLICVVTVSSGIGNKVFDTRAREFLMDSRGLSGEIGHVMISTGPEAFRCDCGARGHLSAVASGRGAARFAQHWASAHPVLFKRSAMAKWVNGRPSEITTMHLAQGARVGDRFVLEILEHVTFPMGQALSILLGGVGIEKIVVVGGFALGVGRPYLRALQNSLIRVELFGRSASDIRRLVRLGSRDDDVGLKGLGLILQNQEPEP